MPLAHETWFVPDYERFGLDWAFAGQTATLALLVAAVAITVAVRVLARRFPGVDIPFLARLAPLLVLLVMGSDPRLRPLVSNLRPPPT